MSSLRSRFAWGTLLLALAAAGFGLSVAQENGPKGNENTVAAAALLPADSVLYLGTGGENAHWDAYTKTAGYEAIYGSGLNDSLEKIAEAFSQVAAAQAGGMPDEMQEKLQQGLEAIGKQGFSAALGFVPNSPQPIPYLTVVLHNAAGMADAVKDLVEKNAKDQIELQEKDVAGRKVTSFMVPDVPAPIEVGWWTEKGHLVVAGGMGGIEAAVAVANGDAPNLTSSENWASYQPDKATFACNTVAWFDFKSLRTKFSNMPLPQTSPDADVRTVNDLLTALGLEKLGVVVAKSGYKGPANWTEAYVEAPAPRTGLLALCDQPTMTLEDLPPLPFGTKGFYACSIDWSKCYEQMIQIVKDVAQFGPPDAAAQVEGAIGQLPDIIGFDPKAGLFDTLGKVSCIYSDSRQAPLGLGFGIAINVKDGAKLRETLLNLAGMAAEQAPPGQFRVLQKEKHGREIVTLQIAGGVNPSFAIDKEWMSIGLFPQTVEAFLLRVDGKLTNWTPTRSYADGLSELPKEFTSISAVDPREGIRFLAGFGPVGVSAAQFGLQQLRALNPNMPAVEFSPADMPPAELIAKPLFPNLAVETNDATGIHMTSRASLQPVLGGPMLVAGAAVGTALLLPAIQSARSAAKRTQSMNNLKQLGLAMHLGHDTHGEFGRGTHDNADLKPEERLSWLADILPFIEQDALHGSINFDVKWNDEANQKWMKVTVPNYQNPGVENPEGEYATTHYVGVAGLGEKGPAAGADDENAGIFAYDRAISFRDISDGTSNTAMIAEVNKKIGPWGQGGPSTIRAFTQKPYLNGPDGFGGATPGRTSFVFADGAVHSISDKVDPSVIENIARIHDGNAVGEFD